MSLQGQRTVSCRVAAADGMVTANETTFSVLGNVLIPVIATEEGQKKLKFDLEKHNTCHCIY